MIFSGWCKKHAGRTINAGLVLLLELLFLFSVWAWDMPSARADSGTITESGVYDIGAYGSDTTITIDPGLAVTFTNTEGITYTNVRISCGADTVLTLDSISIDSSGNSNVCVLSFTDGDCRLILVGNSMLKSGYYQPGVWIQAGHKLTISGDGSLAAYGGYNGAGIGAGNYLPCGNITIESGTVNATGGIHGSGLGGGYQAQYGVITIQGGDVTAKGGWDNAGIGGCDEPGGVIVISGGDVKATGGICAAGIGNGENGDGGSVTISGGAVSAVGSQGGAGIGGGYQGKGGTVTISGGTVTAQGSDGGAGIGGGTWRGGGTVSITAGNVTARGDSGAGIGGGSNGGGGEITISGGVVDAAGSGGAGIGGGGNGSGGTTIISHGQVTARSGYGAGIGGGTNGYSGAIFILDGLVKAASGYGAGIGGGHLGDGELIEIYGGEVSAIASNGSSSSGGAGIGGGSSSGGGDINIYGGTVTAMGGKYAAGIGSGDFCTGAAGTSPCNIRVEGGIVTATGGLYGAGVGSGYCQLTERESSITVTGGIVHATGGQNSAGLGGGSLGSAGVIEISGGWVFAERGDETVDDIGAGKNGAEGSLSLEDSAAVFMKNGTCVSPETATHRLYTPHVSGRRVHGINLPDNWSAPVYAYLNEDCFIKLIFDSNGGNGTVPALESQYMGTTFAVPQGSGLTRSAGLFKEWNTKSDGSGESYNPGDEWMFTADSVLYAMYGGASFTLTAIPSSYNSINLSWQAVDGAAGYEIYRADSEGGEKTLIYTTSLTDVLSFADKGLDTGQEYYYTIWAYENSSPPIHLAYSNTASATPALGAPAANTVSTSFTAIKVSWSAVPGANGYEVWYGTQKFGTYSLKYTSGSGAAGSWIKSGLTTDKAYYFKVRAFRTVNGVKIYSEDSVIQSTAPGRASIIVVRASSTSAKITWITVSGTSGYEVWRGTQKNGTYLLKYTAKSSATSWTNIGLKTGKAYYYKVRAWRVVSGQKVYGQFSAINSVVP